MVLLFQKRLMRQCKGVIAIGRLNVTYLCLMRLCSFLFALFLCISGYSQHPFNYGKTKNIYFLSRKEIAKAGINNIYTTTFPKLLKDVPTEAYVSIIDFSDPNAFRNGWYPYYGKAQRRLSLKELLDSSDFMNGTVYEWDENGRIALNGMEGHGTLCQDEYQHDSLFTYANNFCKFGESYTTRKIFYHKNGLPDFSVCCSIDSLAVEEDTTVAKDDPEDYKDTTWNIYNVKWQVTGTKTKDIIKPIFSFAYSKSDPAERYFINRNNFESFIDKMIGYRPAMLLFEIYRNAVIAFKYDAKAKKYYEAGEISLE
jgi:hypothetical protein